METSSILDVVGTDWLSKVDDLLEEYRPMRQMISLGGRRSGKSTAAAMAAQTYTVLKHRNQPTANNTTNTAMPDTLDAMRRLAQSMNEGRVGIDSFKVWVDEFYASDEKPATGPTMTLDDPKFQGSRVEVWRIEVGSRDPRNPNPQAGTIVTYEVRSVHRIAERVSGLENAKTRARALHKELIEEIATDFLNRNPHFGRF